MFSPAIATFRLLAFALWTLTALLPYLVLQAVNWKGLGTYVKVYFRVVAWICGIRVRAVGAPVERRGPVLYVANHSSYLDIIVLGSLLSANFVAKREVAGWPGFGFLARIARSQFIDRKRGAAGRERDALRERLDNGDSLILFPEGTSNDGNRVLPFKSALFAVAETPVRDPVAGLQPMRVQPVSLAYTRLDGMPMQRAFRPFYAWYGDMTMVGHLPKALGLGRVTAEVVFHPAVTVLDFVDRKALANHCHDTVQRGVVLALAGRWGDWQPPVAVAEQQPLPVGPDTEA